MKTLQFVVFILSILLTREATAAAQGTVMPQLHSRHVVGTLMGGTPEADQQLIVYFKQGMANLGYVEGRNVEYVYRWANGAFDEVPNLVRELITARVEVVVVVGESLARQVQKAAPTMPIVLAGGFDPVAAGLVDNIARPGGSVTGIIGRSYEVTETQLRLVREVLPGARRIGILLSTSVGNRLVLARLQRVARSLGFELIESRAKSTQAIPSAFEHLRGTGVQALVVLASAVFDSDRPTIVDQAFRLGVLTIYPDSGYVEAGGILSYGPTRSDTFFRVATYVNKILRGAKPGILPMDYAKEFELVANEHAATALGIKLPLSVRQRADDVIE